MQCLRAVCVCFGSPQKWEHVWEDGLRSGFVDGWNGSMRSHWDPAKDGRSGVTSSSCQGEQSKR